VTDFRDACFSCGGHLRENAYAGTLCPICELRHERGEITAFGKPVPVPFTRMSIDLTDEGGSIAA
jgi:hypothetical protein